MSILVRPWKDVDYAQVHEIDISTQRQYLGEEFDGMNNREQDSHLVSRESEFQMNVDTGYCFVAEEDARMVGFIFAQKAAPFPCIFVRYIGIRPELQGHGIGLVLYERLISNARQTKIREVWTTISADNPRSIRLHEKAGFTLNSCQRAVRML